jgi:peptidoglycan/xylan/chitin deacetylase (PgdA/CDA1 family)
METARLIERLGHVRCSLMRPPGGAVDENILRLCAGLDLLPVFWSRNTGDWQPRPARDIVRAALTGVSPGDIILLHQGEIASALALRDILAGLRALGLQPGRVADILPQAPLLRGTPAQLIQALQATGCLREEGER